MLEKLKEITIGIVITLFFLKLLPNLEGGKKKKKPNPSSLSRKGGVFLEHFELAINGLL